MELIIYLLIILTFLFDVFLSILNYKNRNHEIPDIIKDVYDNAAYQKWLSYNMENFRLSLIAKVLSVIYIIVLLAFNVFQYFNDLALSITDSSSVQSTIFVLLYFSFEYLINIIISYYKCFSIEERYGFNKSTRRTFILDKIKGAILAILLGGGIILGLSSLYYSTGECFFLYAGIGIIVFVLLINILYTKIFLRLFNKLHPLEEGELKDKIIAFTKRVGYEVNKISVMDASRRTTKLNASFSGFGKFKQVILYDNLLNKMTTEEIVSVLAHEIGHNKHRHIIYNLFFMIINLALYLGIFIYILKSTELSVAFGFNNNFGFSVILFIIILSPLSFIIEGVSNTISRAFEFQADNFAAVNGYKNEMISALKVLSRENFSNLTPHPLYVKIFYSHPPIDNRINAIMKVK